MKPFSSKKLIVACVAVIATVLWAGSASAASLDLQGWAWSDMPDGSDQVKAPTVATGGRGAGWISLNSNGLSSTSISTGYTSAVPYKVTIDSVTGAWAGYGWSEHIGWINFAPIGPYPVYANNPVAGPTKTDWATGRTCGWARAVAGMDATTSGGWDGWISMCGTTMNLLGVTSPFGLYIGAPLSSGERAFISNVPNPYSPYAWGGDVLGYISFNYARVLPGAPTCGTSAGQTFSTAPTTNLCATGGGTASGVNLDASYNPARYLWGCNIGAASTFCTAYSTQVNGTCGTSNGQPLTSAPTTNLCATGTSSALSGSGPWSWTCNGAAGGTNAPCATTSTAGTCGSSNGQTLASAPTSNLCSLGAASTVANNTTRNTYDWTCGASTKCYANKSGVAVNGFCGTQSGSPVNPPGVTPTKNLCLAGTLANMSGPGIWIWNCNGVSGGTNVQCVAADQATCGSSAGQTFSTAPTANLCYNTYQTASPNPVQTNTSTYNWNCSSGAGSGVITNVACVANRQITPPTTTGSCGAATGAIYYISTSDIPESAKCSNGIATSPLITATGGTPGWNYTCVGTGGNSGTCLAKAKTPVCTDNTADLYTLVPPSLPLNKYSDDTVCSYTSFCAIPANASSPKCQNGDINPIIIEN